MSEMFRDTIQTVVAERWPGARLRNLSSRALAELHREVRKRLARTPMRHAWRWN
jgi:hypothetical protein